MGVVYTRLVISIDLIGKGTQFWWMYTLAEILRDRVNVRGV